MIPLSLHPLNPHVIGIWAKGLYPFVMKFSLAWLYVGITQVTTVTLNLCAANMSSPTIVLYSYSPHLLDYTSCLSSLSQSSLSFERERLLEMAHSQLYELFLLGTYTSSKDLRIFIGSKILSKIIWRCWWENHRKIKVSKTIK